MLIAYHFVADKLRDGRPIPPDGEWLIHDGPVEICRSGLHASWRASDALRYAPGLTLCLVEVGEPHESHRDKFVCSRRRITRRFDATELAIDFLRHLTHRYCDRRLMTEAQFSALLSMDAVRSSSETLEAFANDILRYSPSEPVVAMYLYRAVLVLAYKTGLPLGVADQRALIRVVQDLQHATLRCYDSYFDNLVDNLIKENPK